MTPLQKAIEMNGRIVCMVRGGEAGRKVQEHAIAFAHQNKKTIIFVHIVDAQTIALGNQNLIAAAREELTWLGRVTLSMARRRAEQAGIQVEVAILYGSIFEATSAYLSQNMAEKIFIGSPHPGTDDYESRLEQVHLFSERLSQSCGVPVQIVSN